MSRAVNRVLWLACLLTLASLALPGMAVERYSQVLILAPDKATVTTLAGMGLPLDDAHPAKDGLEIPLSERDLAQVVAAGIPHRVLIADLCAHYAAVCDENNRQIKAGQAAAMVRPVGLQGNPPTHMGYGSMGGFYNYSELLAALDNMRTLYPGLISQRVSIGNTLEGRPMWMVKLSRNPDVDEDEPEVYFDGMHHAREPGTYTALLYAAWYLLENYGTDPEATYLLDHREIYLVPVVNVDGFSVNLANAPGGGGMWRKNRRSNGDGSYGVDLNRNFPYQWGYDDGGSSPTPSRDTYRGVSGGSEPETQVVMGFIIGHPFVTSMSIHSYKGLYLYPYGYANVQPEHADVFQEYGSVMASGNGYTAGPIYSTIYPANGGSIDWQLHERGIIAFSPEIGVRGFYPSQQYIMPEAAENLMPILRVSWWAGGRKEVKDLQIVDGAMSPGRSVSLAPSLFNAGMGSSEASVVALLCSDPYVTVVEGSRSVPSLASREGIALVAEPFVVTIAAGCPIGHLTDFVVRVNQAGALIERTFRMPVVAMGVDPITIEVTMCPDQTARRDVQVISGSGSAIAWTAVAQGTSGYTARTSDQADGPTYVWNDIAGTGTLVPSFAGQDDVTAGPFPLGFFVPFYGGVFTQFWISTNGWISLTEPPGSVYANTDLPSASAPSNLVAAMWDDLEFVSGSTVHYQVTDAATMVVQFTNVNYIRTSQYCTFQIVMKSDGRILYYYNRAERSTSATAGIQDATRTHATRVAYNDNSLHAALAVIFRCASVDWIGIDPASGSLAGGATAQVGVWIDTTGLGLGDYRANLVFTNDLGESRTVPVLLHVIAGNRVIAVPAPAIGVIPVLQPGGITVAPDLNSVFRFGCGKAQDHVVEFVAPPAGGG